MLNKIAIALLLVAPVSAQAGEVKINLEDAEQAEVPKCMRAIEEGVRLTSSEDEAVIYWEYHLYRIRVSDAAITCQVQKVAF